MGTVDAAPGSFAERVKHALANQRQAQALRRYQDEIQPYAQQLTREGLPGWEVWRDRVRDVRAHTIGHLDFYLERFADNVTKRGGHIFVAATAREATAYVVDIARKHGVRLAVKSKTMLGEEIGVNAALAAAGVEVVETDLGEYIIQLAGERPAHITGPSIHLSLEDVRVLFSRLAGRQLPPAPDALTRYARSALREKFLSAGMGISGCNFGVASTGSVVLVTNEGNGRLVASVPPVHVVLVGMERLVPDWNSLDAPLTVLPRAGVCGPATAYVTAITGPRRASERDGPDELHVVIVDNGRAALLGTRYEAVLRCIRCGSCIDHCPVWRQIGGQAYGSPYSGPIGAAITPLLGTLKAWPELPFACTLCGACDEVCPARIRLTDLLLQLRADAIEQLRQPAAWRFGMHAFGAVCERPRAFTAVVRTAALAGNLIRRATAVAHLPGPLAAWSKSRELPPLAAQSFSAQWRRKQNKNKNAKTGGNRGA
jgi:L-lactate dehydrogenase complex protein LldF